MTKANEMIDHDEEHAARQSRWGSLTAELEAQLMDEPDQVPLETEACPPRRESTDYTNSEQELSNDGNAVSVPGVGRASSNNIKNIDPHPLYDLSRRLVSLTSLPTVSTTTSSPDRFDVAISRQLSRVSPLNPNSGVDDELSQLQRKNVKYQFQQQNAQLPQPQQHPDQQATTSKIVTLREWMVANKVNADQRQMVSTATSGPSNGNSPKNKFIERSVRIAHSLVTELVRTSCSINQSEEKQKGGAEECEDIEPRPEDLDLDCILVTENQRTGVIEDVSFDVFRNFDWAMDDPSENDNPLSDLETMLEALGKLFFKLFMDGEEVPLPPAPGNLTEASRNENRVSSDGNNMNDVLHGLEKMGTQETEGHINALMRGANLPVPVCRLVSDLLRSIEAKNDKQTIHNNFSFASLSDVLSDLQQMIDNPGAFLYATMDSQWDLIFGNERLFGREEELKTLMDAASRVLNTENNESMSEVMPLSWQMMPSVKKKEVVIVSGVAAAGKSMLVQEMRKLLTAQGWTFLRCKFDKRIHSEPLSVISLAFDEYFSSRVMCSSGIASKHDLSGNSSPNIICPCTNNSCPRKMCHQLENALGLDGIRSLSRQMPQLRQLINDIYPSQSPLDNDEGTMSLATPVQKFRAHYLFVTLLDTLSSFCPVVFFADDLHWADAASIELLTDLISQVGTHFNRGYNTSSLLFVGADRCDEANREPSLTKMLELFQSSDTMNTNHISLGAFPSVEPLHEMVSEALCLPVRRTRALSQKVYQKTRGCPLCTVEFLDVLLTEKLIFYNEGTGWEWDIDAIDSKKMPRGVAELLALKLKRLPHHVLNTLKVVSCFGDCVNLQIVEIIKNYDKNTGPMMIPALQAAQKEGLVEIAGPTFTFAHDLIQQETFDLIPIMDRLPLLQRLADCFINHYLHSMETDSVLFVAVDLINRIGKDAVSNNIDQNRLFAELNHRAGKKSIANTDFASAVKYFNSGISFLQGDYWNDQYGLSLSLFENLAYSNYCEGNHEQVIMQVNQVFDHAKSFEDKFKSYCVYINIIAIDSIDEAMSKLFYLLTCLGMNINPNLVTFPMANADAMDVKQVLLGNQKLGILNSCQMTDRTKLMTMEVMATLVRYYNRQQSYMSGYLACQMIRMSLQYGHCEHTILALAVFSMITLKVLGDAEEAFSLARSSLSLWELYKTDQLIPQVYGIIYGYVLVLQDPIHSSLEPLMRACRVAFSHGNFENAALNTNFYLAHSLRCGKKLDEVMNDVNAFARQYNQHKQLVIVQLVLAPVYKFISALGGKSLCSSDSISKLDMMCDDDLVEMGMHKKEVLHVQTALYITLIESIIQRDFVRAAETLQKHQNKFATDDFVVIFYGGLLAFHMARQTREGHWLAKSANALKTLEISSKQCKWNFGNKYLLLKAEMHNTNGETKAAIQAYDESVEAARTQCFIHEEALACELAAHYFGNIGDKKRTREMIEKSHDAYVRWGAQKKAESVIKLLELQYLQESEA